MVAKIVRDTETENKIIALLMGCERTTAELQNDSSIPRDKLETSLAHLEKAREIQCDAKKGHKWSVLPPN